MRRLAQRFGARMLLQLARRSAAAVGVVLVYHDVGAVAGDPHGELVPPLSTRVFAEQLDHLATHYEPVRLSELRARMRSRAARDRVPVALTFDDDLAGHVEHAAPALSERGIPATFFLTGRSLDGPDPFWWQDLRVAGMEAARDRLARQWRWAAQPGDLHDLARTIENLPPVERDAVADALRELAGTPDPGLPAAAVRALVAGGFDIGFHTRRHDPLTHLDDDRLAQAMDDGRAALEAVAGRRLTAIAYPFGRADLRVSHAAAAAGYELGLIWTGRAVRVGDPPLLIDRADGWAESVDVFAWRLARVVSAGT